MPAGTPPPATVLVIKVDICNVRHPFYTGKQKLVDAAEARGAFPEEVRRRLLAACRRETRAPVISWTALNYVDGLAVPGRLV